MERRERALEAVMTNLEGIRRLKKNLPDINFEIRRYKADATLPDGTKVFKDQPVLDDQGHTIFVDPDVRRNAEQLRRVQDARLSSGRDKVAALYERFGLKAEFEKIEKTPQMQSLISSTERGKRSEVLGDVLLARKGLVTMARSRGFLKDPDATAAQEQEAIAEMIADAKKTGGADLDEIQGLTRSMGRFMQMGVQGTKSGMFDVMAPQKIQETISDLSGEGTPVRQPTIGRDAAATGDKTTMRFPDKVEIGGTLAITSDGRAKIAGNFGLGGVPVTTSPAPEEAQTTSMG